MITSNDKPSPSIYDGSYINSIQDEKSLVDNKISSLLKKLTPTKSPQKRFVRPSAFTENKNDAVKQHHLFIDPFSLEGKSVRKKTFKNQFSGNYGVHTQIKKHPYIEEVRGVRKKHFKELLDLSNSQDQSCARTFYELMLANLREGQSLDVLFPQDFSNEPPDELKKLYNKVLTPTFDNIESFMELDFIKPNDLVIDAFANLRLQYNLVKKQIDNVLLEGYQNLEKSLQKKISKPELVTNKLFVEEVNNVGSQCIKFKKESKNYRFHSFIETYIRSVNFMYDSLDVKNEMTAVCDFIKTFWNNEFVVPNPTALKTCRNTDLKQSIKDCFNQIKTKNKSEKLDFILKGNIQNKELNELLKYTLDFLYDKYNSAKVIHNKNLEVLKQDLKTYVLDAANLAFFKEQKKRMLSEDPDLMKTLTREYKQHSLARFDHLFNHFTAFVNVIEDLGNLGNKKYPNFKVNFQEIVSHLIINSTIENVGQSEDKTLKDIMTVIPDLHRETMGKEEKPKTDVESSLIRTKLNLLLNSKDVIVEVDRSHTLPFPVLFAWDPRKIKNIINSRYKEKAADDYSSKEKNSYFSYVFFEKMKQNNFSHKEIVDLFHQEFEANLNQDYTEKQLLFKSLVLVKDFFLKLFSETELLPEFMNKSVDAVSEWKIAGNNNYKTSLAQGLYDLIQMKGPIKESDTVVRLLPYLNKTFETAEEHFKREKQKTVPVKGKEQDPTPASVWNLVCLSLVKEAVMKTVEGVAFKEAAEHVNKNIKELVKNKFFDEFSITDKAGLVRALNEANSFSVTAKHDEIIKEMFTPIKV